MQAIDPKIKAERVKIARLVYIDAQTYIKMDDSDPRKEEIGRRLDRLYAFYGFLRAVS